MDLSKEFADERACLELFASFSGMTLPKTRMDISGHPVGLANRWLSEAFLLCRLKELTKADPARDPAVLAATKNSGRPGQLARDACAFFQSRTSTLLGTISTMLGSGRKLQEHSDWMGLRLACLAEGNPEKLPWLDPVEVNLWLEHKPVSNLDDTTQARILLLGQVIRTMAPTSSPTVFEAWARERISLFLPNAGLITVFGDGTLEKAPAIRVLSRPGCHSAELVRPGFSVKSYDADFLVCPPVVWLPSPSDILWSGLAEPKPFADASRILADTISWDRLPLALIKQVIRCLSKRSTVQTAPETVSDTTGIAQDSASNRGKGSGVLKKLGTLPGFDSTPLQKGLEAIDQALKTQANVEEIAEKCAEVLACCLNAGFLHGTEPGNNPWDESARQVFSIGADRGIQFDFQLPENPANPVFCFNDSVEVSRQYLIRPGYSTQEGGLIPPKVGVSAGKKPPSLEALKSSLKALDSISEKANTLLQRWPEMVARGRFDLEIPVKLTLLLFTGTRSQEKASDTYKVAYKNLVECLSQQSNLEFFQRKGGKLHSFPKGEVEAINEGVNWNILRVVCPGLRYANGGSILEPVKVEVD